MEGAEDTGAEGMKLLQIEVTVTLEECWWITELIYNKTIEIGYWEKWSEMI